MGQRIFSILFVAALLSSFSASAGTLEVPLSAIFQNSPLKLGRSIGSTFSESSAAPLIVFKHEMKLDQLGLVNVGARCRLSAIEATQAETHAYFSAPLSVSPGGKIPTGASYSMSLISDQQEMLKIKLSSENESVRELELTCTHPHIQEWTITEFEAALNHGARVHVSANLAKIKSHLPTTSATSGSLNSMNGSSLNGLFGSGLPGTTGIQLMLGANLKAYAEKSNAPLMVGKRCKLVSQNGAAFSDRYLKGSKFAFREARPGSNGRTEFVFDNWNQSPHQVKVECRGDIKQVNQMTLAQVEHDLNGTIQFYSK